MNTTTKKGRPSVSQKAIRHWQRCRRDFPFYATQHLRIVTKSAKVVNFELRYAQQVVHAKLTKQLQDKGFVKAIILKARQEGISTYTAARFFRRVHLFNNQKAMIIADQKDKGAVLFDIYERYHRYLEEEQNVHPRRYGEKGMRLVLENDSSINVETARDAYAARGSTVQALHASEMAFWDKAADTWNSISQAVPDEGSEIIIESTANGVGNFFHQMWEDAEQGRSDYIAIFLPWWIHEEYSYPHLTDEERAEIENSSDPFERLAQDHGIEWEGDLYKLTPEQLMWRRKTIANKSAGNLLMFQQEYPSTADEAFIVTGDGFFDVEVLREYKDCTRPPRHRGRFTNDGGSMRFVPDPLGPVRVWQMPGEHYCHLCKVYTFDESCPECKQRFMASVYVVGGDTASGKRVGGVAAATDEKGGTDFSVGDVVDAINLDQVAQVHGRIVPEVFAEQLWMLGYFYATRAHSGGRPALLAVEKNHWSGETVLKLLQQKLKYPNLYYSRQEGKRFNRPTPVLGWHTNTATRGPLLDGLAMALRDRAIDVPCAETVREFTTFVRAEDGKPQAQEGSHDDRVIALAIALRAAEQVPRVQKPTAPPPFQTGSSPTGWGDY